MTDTVLIVDDDPVQRRLLDAMLKRFGYDVASADNGEAALTMLGAPVRLHEASTSARRDMTRPSAFKDQPWT